MDNPTTHLPGRWVAIIAVSLLAAGCQKSGGGSLSGDARALEHAFSLTAASLPAGDTAGFKEAATPALVKTLTVALRSDDMATAAKALHVLNYRGAGLSFDQFDTIRQAYGDVGRRLSQRASAGDQEAKELLNQM